MEDWIEKTVNEIKAEGLWTKRLSRKEINQLKLIK